MNKVAWKFFIMTLSVFQIAGCTGAMTASPTSTASPALIDTIVPTYTNPPSTYTLTSTEPVSVLDRFQAEHPSWKVAFVEPTSRQLCIQSQNVLSCLSYQDYEFPGGYRRQLGSWSPDGTRFAWDHDDDSGIYLWTIGQGTEPFKVSADGMVYRYPVWSPDGNFIAYQLETVAFSDLAAETEGLYIESLDHSIKYHLSQQKSIADWSADSQKIVYSENNPSLSEGSIISANMDGTQLQTLLRHPGQVYRPRWSPDGLHLAFLADPEQQKIHLYVLDADSSAARDLGLFEYGNSQAFLNYSWLPDGKHILYADSLIDIETGSVTRLHFSFDPFSAIWFMK